GPVSGGRVLPRVPDRATGVRRHQRRPHRLRSVRTVQARDRRGSRRLRSRNTVGEDAELIVRLHRFLRDRDEEYRIRFVPDPVCWTEAPEALRTLSRQRRRWQRGMGETLVRHRRAIANPRAGALGMVTLPYYLIFEFLGSIVELLGIPVVLAAWLLGALSIEFLLAFLAVSVLLSVFLSFAAILLEEYVVRRHERAGDIALLVLYGILDNFGYRQMTSFWRCRGAVDLLRGRSDWGQMQRRGLERPAEAPLPPPGPARG